MGTKNNQHENNCLVNCPDAWLTHTLRERIYFFAKPPLTDTFERRLKAIVHSGGEPDLIAWSCGLGIDYFIGKRIPVGNRGIAK